MTGATADRFRIPERGYLRPGCKADITILDESALSVDETKPDRKPGGVAHVFINGTPVLTDGVYHGGCAGAVVLKKITRPAAVFNRFKAGAASLRRRLFFCRKR